MTTRRRATWHLAIALVVSLLVGACASAEAPASLPALAVDRSGLDARRSGSPELVVVSPADGARVTSPVEVTIQVDNYSLAAKGVSKDGEGHFHVVEGACIEPGEVIGDDHTHVGSGAATVLVELEPGPRELCLQLGDGFHTALAITRTVNVNVVQNSN